jgi:hypothetical protein
VRRSILVSNVMDRLDCQWCLSVDPLEHAIMSNMQRQKLFYVCLRKNDPQVGGSFHVRSKNAETPLPGLRSIN